MGEHLSFVSCGYGLQNSSSHLPQNNSSADFFNHAELTEKRLEISQQLTDIVPEAEMEALNSFLTTYNSLATPNEVNQLTSNCIKQIQVLEQSQELASAEPNLSNSNDAGWIAFDKTLPTQRTSYDNDEWNTGFDAN